MIKKLALILKMPLKYFEKSRNKVYMIARLREVEKQLDLRANKEKYLDEKITEINL